MAWIFSKRCKKLIEKKSIEVHLSKKVRIRILKLLEQFNEITLITIFEIEVSEGEYEIYNISADSAKIYIQHTDISVNWDSDFSLDSHLETLYEECYEDAINKE